MYRRLIDSGVCTFKYYYYGRSHSMIGRVSVVYELVEEKKTLIETAAGRELHNDINGFRVCTYVEALPCSLQFALRQKHFYII